MNPSARLNCFYCELLCSENSVSGIAETRYNVAVFIQVIVHFGNIDVHVGMLGLNLCNAFGSADFGHKLNVLAAVLLDEGDCGCCAAAGCEHRVN